MLEVQPDLSRDPVRASLEVSQGEFHRARALLRRGLLRHDVAALRFLDARPHQCVGIPEVLPGEGLDENGFFHHEVVPRGPGQDGQHAAQGEESGARETPAQPFGGQHPESDHREEGRRDGTGERGQAVGEAGFERGDPLRRAEQEVEGEQHQRHVECLGQRGRAKLDQGQMHGEEHARPPPARPGNTRPDPGQRHRGQTAEQALDHPDPEHAVPENLQRAEQEEVVERGGGPPVVMDPPIVVVEDHVERVGPLGHPQRVAQVLVRVIVLKRFGDPDGPGGPEQDRRNKDGPEGGGGGPDEARAQGQGHSAGPRALSLRGAEFAQLGGHIFGGSGRLHRLVDVRDLPALVDVERPAHGESANRVQHPVSLRHLASGV